MSGAEIVMSGVRAGQQAPGDHQDGAAHGADCSANRADAGVRKVESRTMLAAKISAVRLSCAELRWFLRS